MSVLAFLLEKSKSDRNIVEINLFPNVWLLRCLKTIWLELNARLTLLPCPPLLVAPPPWRPCAALSRKLSRALRLRETATLALASLAESTLELPSSRPHLLARVLRADDGPDDGDGDGDGDGATGEVSPRESSVSVNFAGNFSAGNWINIFMEKYEIIWLVFLERHNRMKTNNELHHTQHRVRL